VEPTWAGTPLSTHDELLTHTGAHRTDGALKTRPRSATARYGAHSASDTDTPLAVSSPFVVPAALSLPVSRVAVPGTSPTERSGEVPVFKLVAELTGEVRTAPRHAAEADPDARSGAGLDDDPVAHASAGLDGYEARRSRKWIWLGLAVVLGLAAITSGTLLSGHRGPAPSALSTPQTPAPADSGDTEPTVTISKVVDADTVEVTGTAAGTVDVLGMVAPRAERQQCGAGAATAFAERILFGSTVTLVSDPSQPATDKAGRRLALLRLANGTDYTVRAVRAGMARYYDSGTHLALATQIKTAQAQAQETKQGIWGAPCNTKRGTAATSTASTARH
jgi:endonuclease YncB( thermonuclease family)